MAFSDSLFASAMRSLFILVHLELVIRHGDELAAGAEEASHLDDRCDCLILRCESSRARDGRK